MVSNTLINSLFIIDELCELVIYFLSSVVPLLLFIPCAGRFFLNCTLREIFLLWEFAYSEKKLYLCSANGRASCEVI